MWSENGTGRDTTSLSSYRLHFTSSQLFLWLCPVPSVSRLHRFNLRYTVRSATVYASSFPYAYAPDRMRMSEAQPSEWKESRKKRKREG